MAATAVSPFASIMFSSEFQYLEFVTDLGSLKFRLATDTGATLLEETYTPDDRGYVTLYDLDRLIDSYLGTASIAIVSIYLDDVLKTAPVVLRSTVSHSVDAWTFVQDHFLVSSSDIRDTRMGRYECLNFYALKTEQLRCSALVVNGGSVFQRDFTLQTNSQLNQIVTIDVSPDKILNLADAAAQKLLSYEIVLGNRHQKYSLSTELADADPAFMFRNRYNVWDTFYFCGTKESDPQFDRLQAWINGQYLTYKVEEIIQFSAKTHPLRPEAIAFIEDIARSAEIRILDSAGVARDLVTITGQELKATNDFDAMTVLTITYRFADRVTAKSFQNYTARIFDLSFDKSYE